MVELLLVVAVTFCISCVGSSKENSHSGSAQDEANGELLERVFAYLRYGKLDSAAISSEPLLESTYLDSCSDSIRSIVTQLNYDYNLDLYYESVSLWRQKQYDSSVAIALTLTKRAGKNSFFGRQIVSSLFSVAELEGEGRSLLRRLFPNHQADSIYARYLIANHEVAFGMTTAQVLESWGRPLDINRTRTATYTHEQWVYPRANLYFDDGVLTSIQD